MDLTNPFFMGISIESTADYVIKYEKLLYQIDEII